MYRDDKEVWILGREELEHLELRELGAVIRRGAFGKGHGEGDEVCVKAYDGGVGGSKGEEGFGRDHCSFDVGLEA